MVKTRKAKSMRTAAAVIGVVVSLLGCARNQPAAVDDSLATALAHPDAVTDLNLSGMDMDVLPEKLWTLHNLRRLNLPCSEKLTKLPPQIGQLRLLEKLVLDCGNGGVMNVSLPEETGSLQHLTVLTLHGALDARSSPGETPAIPPRLPEAVRNLTRLRELDLSRNGLPSVPEQIGSLVNLEMLDLSFNDIRAIPEFVGNLRKLHKLSLEGNHHGLRLPSSLSHASGLKVTAGNNYLDLKSQEALRRTYPGIDFDFQDEFDDCSANEPPGGYPEWQKESCGPLPLHND
jgi:hypothetical protein